MGAKKTLKRIEMKKSSILTIALLATLAVAGCTPEQGGMLVAAPNTKPSAGKSPPTR